MNIFIDDWVSYTLSSWQLGLNFNRAYFWRQKYFRERQICLSWSQWEEECLWGMKFLAPAELWPEASSERRWAVSRSGEAELATVEEEAAAAHRLRCGGAPELEATFRTTVESVVRLRGWSLGKNKLRLEFSLKWRQLCMCDPLQVENGGETSSEISREAKQSW